MPRRRRQAVEPEDLEPEVELEPPPVDEEPRGLECRRCGCGHFFVLYTRPSLGGRIVRRRQCRHCGRRMTTTEKVQG